MESRDFCYWLQGVFELAAPRTLNEKQTTLIKKHLNLVFAHEIDPSFEEDKEVLVEMHEAPPLTSSFAGDKTTLEDLFGSTPISASDAMRVLSDYFRTKAMVEAVQEAARPVKPPVTPRAPRPGVTLSGPRSDPWNRRIMC